MQTKSNQISETNKREQLSLKLLLELLFLLEKAHARGGCQGARRKGKYMSLFTWAGTFFYLFFVSIVRSHKFDVCMKMVPKMNPRVDSFRSCFQKA